MSLNRSLVRCVLFAGVAWAALADAASAQTYNRLVVFGDSLSDNGNLALATNNALPGYPSQRFSNGPVWVEYLNSTILNLGPLQNYTGSATNGQSIDLAFGGARTDTLNGLAPPGIPTQISLYSAFGGTFGPNNLVTLWGGANDLFQGLDALSTPVGAQATMAGIATAGAGNVAASAAQLSTLGAKTVLIPNVPNLGLTPSYNIDAATSALATYSAATLNANLLADMRATAAAHPGTNYILMDTYSILNAVVADPSAFGFTNVTQACVSVPSCVNASTAAQNRYLFWDDVHPTTYAHYLLAQAAAQYVYAPTLALYSGSLGEMGVTDRKAAAERGLDRLRDHAGSTDKNDYFVDAIGNFGSSKATDERYKYDYETGGVNFGLTRNIGNGFTLGAAGNIDTGKVHAGNGNVLSYDPTQFSADILAGYRSGQFFVNGTLGAGVSLYNSWKRKTVGPLANTADSSGSAFSTVAEAGYDFKTGMFTLTPIARLGFIAANVDSFTENGIVAPIHYNSRTIDAVTGAAELRASAAVLQDKDRQVNIFGLVGYGDFLSYHGDTVKGILSNNISQPFVSQLTKMGGDGLLLGAGVNGAYGAMRFNVSYRAGLGAGHGSGAQHQVTAGLRYEF
ncbi:autotransporter domain-containing protein [Methylovirgula sp. 4M-Z18]|uniref:autotransporter domain-containing protein n=1 Tax=Methylovirgula sp. 4M-Z18 TaxID=2293567 RepID=UPI000E2FDA42|nr:autotransporter domain-containing protein [Methylovirgula sp. 4M-Z18]RFB80814.1 autotransporter domain-containing protein [Methylovirgula sp. 4M-Z18]